MKLSKIEQYFKLKYHKFGNDFNLKDARKDFSKNGLMSEYSKVFSLLMNNTIESDLFFDNDQPIELFRHLRYLPPTPHKHDHFEVIYLYSGQAVNKINNDEIIMRAGDICILSPETIHSISTFSDDTIIYNLLIRNEIFESQFIDFAANSNNILSNFFSLSLLKNVHAYIFFTTHNDKNIKEFVRYIIKEHGSNRKYKKEMINNLVSAFFILLTRNHEEHVFSSHLTTDIKNKKDLEIIKYIQSNYSNISLSSVAEKFSYSERQISRIVKSFTNISFGKFVTKLKIEKAKTLIKTTNMPIESIASIVGYKDQSTFYRQFKKSFGISPASFRENK